MSYIRCLSNPEGLYVWGGSDGMHIHYGGRKKPMPPLSRGDEMLVPYETFKKACRKWDEDWSDSVIVRGFAIKEVHVYLKTGKPVPDFKSNKDAIRYVKNSKKHPSEFKIKVSYKGNFIYLWRVTWQYVVNNVMERQRKRHKARRKARK